MDRYTTLAMRQGRTVYLDTGTGLLSAVRGAIAAARHAGPGTVATVRPALDTSLVWSLPHEQAVRTADHVLEADACGTLEPVSYAAALRLGDVPAACVA